MQLSKRLQAVADFVTPQSRLADVGTDHAYVPIFLAEEKKIARAVAMDIVDGPLQRARENIAAHHLEDVIETRKSDGLAALQPGEADTAVIAGMGGLLICRILEQGRRTALSLRELVLEPQSDTDKVREYLLKNGYVICDEEMVLEDGKYYPVLKARPPRKAEQSGMQEEAQGRPEPGGAKDETQARSEKSDSRDAEFGAEAPYRAVELLYGRHLLGKKHPVLRQYLEKERQTCRRLLENLSKASGERARARETEIAKDLEMAEQALRMIDNGVE